MSGNRTEHKIVEDFQGRDLPFRIVLVMQGGGALGAYHGGVYQALHENGLEPDWIIGTSIGAISGAIIAGNPLEKRLQQLKAFWQRIAPPTTAAWDFLPEALRRQAAKHIALTTGVPGLYGPNLAQAFGWRSPVGVEHAALYSSAPLAKTLEGLIDFAELNTGTPRFSFSLVHVEEGTLHNFDNRETEITLAHILASAALPPSFPSVPIGGARYWDAGFYNNTPLDAAFEDMTACNSIIFVPNLWPLAGGQPQSLAEAWSRQKSITFASRAEDHVVQRVQLHRLRHVIHHLIDMLPADKRETLKERNFAGHGRESFVHLVQLNAHGFDQEDPFNDIDFTSQSVGQRWDLGYADTCRMLKRQPWNEPVTLINGVALHNSES